MMTHPETLLSEVRNSLQRTLSIIGQLDQLAERKTQESLTLQNQLIDNIQHLKTQGRDSNTPFTHQLYKEIMTLEEEIEQLCQEKVRLANALHCQVANASQEVDSFLGPVDPEGEDPEIKDCLREQALEWCICEGEDRRTAGNCMVLCQGKQCAHRWFHLGCVGLTPSSIPEIWYCPSCKDKNYDPL